MEESDIKRTSGLQRTLRILRRRAWIVALCVIVVPVVAFGLSALQTKKYTAAASLLFNEQSPAEEAAGITSTPNTDPTGQRATNLLLVQLANVAASQYAASALDHRITPSQIRTAVSATQSGQSDIVAIAATWTDAQTAAQIANAYTAGFIKTQRQADQVTVQSAINLVNQQFNALTKSQQATTQGQALLDRVESLKVVKSLQNNERIVQSAVASSSPSSPKTGRNVGIGIVFGLLLGLLLAFQLDNFDQRLRETQEVEESFGLPLLGMIPHGGGRPTRASPEGWTVDLDAFRILRANLRYFNVDRELRALLVVSPAPAEGKTTVAHGLAVAAATMGTRTLLIETDLRGPVLARALNLGASPGLAGALIGASSLEAAVRHVGVSPSINGGAARVLDVIPAGGLPPNPAEMLESQAMQHTLTWAREQYDFVVIDSAPLSIVPDAVPLLNLVDGVVIVSRLGRSRRDAASRLREQLDNLRAPTLGVVVNDLRTRRSSYYGYGDGRYASDTHVSGKSGIHDVPHAAEVAVPTE